MTDGYRDRMLIRPTLRLQSIGFCIGSTFFFVGAVPGLASVMGALTTNIVFFIGSWFFTGAAFIQLLLAGPRFVAYKGSRAISAVWLVASAQFVGTLLFNVSTGAAITAHGTRSEQVNVWVPDAAGSVAFLVSACFAMLGLIRSHELMKLIYRDTISGWSNWLGCVAFGLSAIGGFVYANGATADSHLANLGTMIGAICFFVASIFYVGRAGEEPAGVPEPVEAGGLGTG
ncbi:hypothetical protein GCM10023353_03930 [Tomitella cavernea]|uniref:Uncharacterized protein n=2 Tax=Tomitella cavernea TaxID=1387982 RepID=A0ABP9C737_9ACTN